MQTKNTLPNIGEGNTIIYGCIVGSHAYGTNVEGSDVDKKWIYVQSADDLFINGYRPQIEISKDEIAFELSRFLELAQKANPTILELLFSPEDCVLYKHPSFNKISFCKKIFLTKLCKFSFGGYAISQIEKAKGLDKKMNWEKEKTERKSVLDFCYWISKYTHENGDTKFISTKLKDGFDVTKILRMGLSAVPHTRDLYNLYLDGRYLFKGVVQDEETSNDISLSLIPMNVNCIGMLYFNKDAYQIHCREYKEYQEWLSKRNTQRYVDIENHGQQIDGKNMLHCIRLIDTAIDIAEKGDLIIRRPNAEYLKEIRHGKHNLENILKYAQDSIKRLNEVFDKSKLLPPKFSNESYIKIVNSQVRKEIRRLQSKEEVK
jgi:predicted nucleotidyltransferase